MDNKNESKEEKKDVKPLTIINGGVTAENIAAWKGIHGRISEVAVDDPDVAERHLGWVRRPDMKMMQAFSAAAKANEIKASELLFDNCWLGGSPALKTDAVYKMEAMNAMQGIFSKCVRSLKNL